MISTSSPSSSRNGLQYVVYALFVAELVLFNWQRNCFGPYASPVILYLLAIALVLSTLSFARGRRWELAPPLPNGPIATWGPAAWQRLLAVATGAVAGGWYNTNLVKREIWSYRPILEFADIIPALQAYARRWLNGSEIYTPLTWELGYFELPTYLPAMWFPFILAERLGFDYRLVAWGIFLLGVLLYDYLVWRLRQPWPQTLALAALPFVVFYALITTQWAYVGITVEYMILGYYTLLVVGILLRFWPLQALALLLCVLSRYSLVFWVPLYLGLMFFYDSKKNALLVAGTVLVGVVALYIVPYLSHNWGLFMEVQRSYTDAAVFEWKHVDSLGVPLHPFNGLGLASFFYTYAPGSLYEKIGLLKTVHVALLLTVVAVAAVVYVRQRTRRTDYRVYLVAILKLYLATFYAFLQVPYPYLATLGLFMSVFMVLITVGLRQPLEAEPVAAEL